MKFDQHFFYHSGLLGRVFGFKHPDVIFEGVYLNGRVSVALLVFTALKLYY